MAAASQIPDRDKRREQALVEAHACMARIKEVIRRHYSSWRKLPAAPDPDPFILLANDLFALQCILESEIWDDAASRALIQELRERLGPLKRLKAALKV